jgi:hypothetical protein
LDPGIYSRSDPAVDPTLLLQLSALGVSAKEFVMTALADFGVAELPAPMVSYESATLAWDLYKLESQMAPLAPALAEIDGAAYLVLLSASDDKIDTLAETVFFPAVDALAPVE